MAWLLVGIFTGIIVGSVGMLIFLAWITEGRGCEFCDNGDHLNLSDKYGHRVNCTYCPSCGRRVD